MHPLILDGKKTSQDWLVQTTTALHATPLTLAVILVGDDPASLWYIKKKAQTCQKYGIDAVLHTLPATTAFPEVLDLIQKLNTDTRVTGILLQLPLPTVLESERNTLLNAIAPHKDVDGLGAYQQGLLVQHAPDAIVSATAQGIVYLLTAYQIELTGAHVVIVGASQLVGLPLMLLLTHAGATVTLCHKYTRSLASHTSSADILISATGVPHLISTSHVKQGAVVVDVGTTVVDGVLTGDVDFATVSHLTSAITPVPGGVGPMTIAALIANIIRLGAIADLSTK
jgi:methylenetetrahydrofolate dehydrogenase (NADP+) / methenyltetrahydrofolate cyclohydrolase